MSVPAPLRAMRAAFVFLTRVPFGGFAYSDADWAWSSAHFPLVGIVLGVVLGLANWALFSLGSLAAAFVTVAIAILLTGAFHEDGLADTSDALGGGYDREKIFLILKDSRIGTFGGAALVLSIAIRASCAARIGADVTWAWALVGCAARVGPVVLMAVMPYATSDDVSKSRLVTRARWPQALTACAWFVVAASIAIACGWTSLARTIAIAAAIAIVVAVTGWRYSKRLGGLTGDFLGATEQLCEMAGFAVLAWNAS